MTEIEFQDEIEVFFKKEGAPYIREFQVGNSRVDFAICDSDMNALALLEIKTGLDDQVKLKDLADYFEQCMKYRIKSGLPVFLGVFVDEYFGAMKYFTGGEKHKSIAGFSALGGRIDIGVCSARPHMGKIIAMSFWMRQKVVAKFGHMDYNQKAMWFEDMPKISFDGAASKKERK